MNDQLKKAIENEFVRKAPRGFSDRVMDRIFEIKEKLVVKPLISKWGWLTIIIAVLALIIFVFRLPVSEKEPGDNLLLPFFEKVSQQADKISFQMPDFLSNPNIMLIVFGVSFAIFLLLSLDMLLFNRKKGRG